MKRLTTIISVTALLAILSLQLRAQDAGIDLGFAFYDVDRLYDTLPSPFYNDDDYTPEGRLRWTSERYERKVAQIAAVIDSMAMPVVALYGVENEQTVRDIVARSGRFYSYIHRTLNTLDGLDFALLYYGDVLFPTHVANGMNSMVVEAQTGGQDVTIILARRSRDFPDIVEKARQRNPQTFIIAAGDLRDTEYESTGLRDATAHAESSGQGTALYSDGWRCTDRIIADRRSEADAGIYIRRWMLDRRGAPSATYDGRFYRGGAGRKLPIFIIFKRKSAELL